MSMGSDTDLETLLAGWLPERRWFPAKGRDVTVRILTRIAVPPTPAPAPAQDPGAVVEILIVALDPTDDHDGTVLVQVPVVLRPRSATGTTRAGLVGEVATPDGPREVVDGPQDPAYVRAVLAMLAGGVSALSAGGWLESAPGAAAALAGGTPRSWRLLAGEQSNTSVITEAAGPVIAKVFRGLQPGENPDAVLQTALAAAGSARVAAPVGRIRAGWTLPGGAAVGVDLVFASRFLDGAQDAWRTAVAAVTDRRDFSTDAADLGAATAEVHADLARVLPVEPATGRRLQDLAAGIAERVRWAVASAPTLDEDVAARAQAAVAGVADLDRAPAWQRIHGDLHLGQVLRPPGRGWVLLDFEGEPLRDMTERCALDTPLRDVAGMLRSFDYAAAVGGEADPAAAQEWALAAREAFCDGYAGVAGRDPRADDVLLRALELEKALYEVVYETRNRPDWVRVPLGAIGRLLGR